MRDAINDLYRRMNLESIEIKRRKVDDICRHWSRQSGLCAQIRQYYREMQEDVDNWDYERQPFHMKRRKKTYRLMLFVCKYKKGSKSQQLPIALYDIGYNAHNGARDVVRRDLMFRIRNAGISELKADFPHKNFSALGELDALGRGPLWTKETVFDYWVSVYKIMSTCEGGDAPETSTAAAARAASRGAETDGGASSSAAPAAAATSTAASSPLASSTVATASSSAASASSSVASASACDQDDESLDSLSEGDSGEVWSYGYETSSSSASS